MVPVLRSTNYLPFQNANSAYKVPPNKQKTQANLFHDLLRDVINSFAVKPEAVNAVGSVDQLPDIFSDVLGQLLEQQLRLFFRQRPHL